MGKAKITKEVFDHAKRNIGRYGKAQAMRRFNFSMKTAVQIECSKDYRMYRRQVKAQHPLTTYSLAEDVLTLHYQIFWKDNTYIAPRSAKLAITELLNKGL